MSPDEATVPFTEFRKGWGIHTQHIGGPTQVKPSSARISSRMNAGPYCCYAAGLTRGMLDSLSTHERGAPGST